LRLEGVHLREHDASPVIFRATSAPVALNDICHRNSVRIKLFWSDVPARARAWSAADANHVHRGGNVARFWRPEQGSATATLSPERSGTSTRSGTSSIAEQRRTSIARPRRFLCRQLRRSRLATTRNAHVYVTSTSASSSTRSGPSSDVNRRASRTDSLRG
jgi:hypothetical protein